MRALVFVVAVLGVSVSACSSTVLETTVSNGWKPAQGAEVSIECPTNDGETKRRALGTTDENGHFELADNTGRGLYEKCSVVVGERRFAVPTVCVEPNGTHCKRAVIETDLTTSDGRAKK